MLVLVNPSLTFIVFYTWFRWNNNRNVESWIWGIVSWVCHLRCETLAQYR